MAGFWDGVLTVLNNPKVAWDGLVSRFKNLGLVNYRLGCLQAERGLVADAIVRFRIATWADPRIYQAWYNMGCCYLAQGKQERAINAFKQCLLIKKNHPDTLYMLATIDPRILPANLQPQTMHYDLAVSHFNTMAPTYDEAQLNVFKYQGHLALNHLVQRAIGRDAADLTILELGCGTGLCGPVFRKIAKTLIGVDLSPEMLNRAALLRTSDGLPVYNALRRDDLRQFMLQYQGEPFDLVISANTMSYVGDLTPVFEGVNRVLKPGGYFAFSTDISRNPGKFEMLLSMARFGHSVEYLRAEAARVGFEEIHHEEIRAYPDYLMQQIIFRKPLTA